MDLLNGSSVSIQVDYIVVFQLACGAGLAELIGCNSRSFFDVVDNAQYRLRFDALRYFSAGFGLF